jgi:hypothetical protein
VIGRCFESARLEAPPLYIGVPVTEDYVFDHVAHELVYRQTVSLNKLGESGNSVSVDDDDLLLEGTMKQHRYLVIRCFTLAPVASTCCSVMVVGRYRS